ncbi:MAG TPA: N4-gp56 family major capsid protein [Candidatus Saccharimonadales bacterium]|nr:N4-gp56 family major capsid protein [Candidatus Saccharimonadales bacterium]
MAAITTQNPADFANRTQTYFNPKLLKAVIFNLVLATYGWTQKYPAIGTSIRFFRPRAANTSGVAAIAEGTTPATLTETAVGYVDVPLSQRGALASITDLVQAIDLLNTVQMYVATMGSDAALDLDSVIRNALITGLADSNGTYAGAYFERFAGVVNTGNSANDFATLAGLSAANSKMTRTRHLAMVTQLKAAKVPKRGGQYVAVVCPEIMHDVRQDTDWIEAATRDYPNKALFKDGEISLDGAVFVEQNNPFRENVYKTNAAAGKVFSALYLGDGAFGTPELSNNKAGGSPMGPKLNILAQPDKADPLNLKTLVGWKAYYGAKALITNEASDVPHYGILRVQSTFA